MLATAGCWLRLAAGNGWLLVTAGCWQRLAAGSCPLLATRFLDRFRPVVERGEIASLNVELLVHAFRKTRDAAVGRIFAMEYEALQRFFHCGVKGDDRLQRQNVECYRP